jgi:hypothetical protein
MHHGLWVLGQEFKDKIGKTPVTSQMGPADPFLWWETAKFRREIFLRAYPGWPVSGKIEETRGESWALLRLRLTAEAVVPEVSVQHMGIETWHLPPKTATSYSGA